MHRLARRQALKGLTTIAMAATVWACNSKPKPESNAKPSVSAGVDEAQLAAVTISAELERTDLKLGVIKLTDCAPIIIAKEKGYFEEEGLNVSLEAQANWKVLLDRVISGELDGAHMLAGQPIGATIGIGTKAHLVTALSLDLNGNAITVSNEVWKKMQAADPRLAQPKPPHPISAKALLPVVEEWKEKGT